MSIDMNVKNYSPEELTDILGLNYPATLQDIKEKTNTYIEKYKKNPEMVSFFKNIQSALIEDSEPDSTYTIPVKKDVLNPILKNVVTRLVNIDSQYRDNTFENIHSNPNEYSSTYFNANLNDSLCNVLSITLDNVIIPKTWYAVDVYYNNNFFWITNQGQDYIIFLESGNYSGSEFVTAMNNAFIDAGFTSPSNTFCSYTSTTNMFTFLLNNCVDPSGIELNINSEDTQQLDEYAYFTFYDVGNVKLFRHSQYTTQTNICSLSSTLLDNTLGWLMGFRLPYVSINANGNTGDYPINLCGPTYFLVVLIDYQTNRMNNEIVTISNKNIPYIELPEYINTDLLYNCIKINNNTSSPINENMVDQLIFNTSNPISVRQYVPTAPRLLTQTQLYTANEIIKNNAKKTADYRTIGPTNNDVIGLIPVNTQGLREGNVFIQDKIRANKRVFFGPVDIEKFTVKLINDKGQMVNLNGSNWSFTLNVEILYQL
jgi:hypothetical protein